MSRRFRRTSGDIAATDASAAYMRDSVSKGLDCDGGEEGAGGQLGEVTNVQGVEVEWDDPSRAPKEVN